MKDANREARLKAALRANLKRRKEQMRNRSSTKQSLCSEDISQYSITVPQCETSEK